MRIYLFLITVFAGMIAMTSLGVAMTHGGLNGFGDSAFLIYQEGSEQSHAFLPLVMRSFGAGQPTVTETPWAGTATNTPTPTISPTPTHTATLTPTPTKTATPGVWREVGIGSASGGGISQNDGSSGMPSLAIALDGSPYVAWRDLSESDSEIYVRHWNGHAWVEVGSGSASGGGISNNDGASEYPSLAIAPDGTLYVSWEDDSDGDREIYVRRFDGNAWVEVGLGSASGGGISQNSGDSHHPTMAIAPDGTPYIAWWDESGGNSEIYVRRWNGSGWKEVGTGSASGGGISHNAGNSFHPSMAIAPDGTLYIAWYDYSGGDDEIYVLCWNGNSWEEVGTGSASGGGISNNWTASEEPSLAVAADGTPYVAWVDYKYGGTNTEIYVRRYNGSSWEEVGLGSASNGGISQNSGASWYPSLATAPDGTPYIAWQDNSDGDQEIYILHWNGNTWEEVGAGSASGGGISQNDTDSYTPSLAIAPNGTPYIVWSDDSPEDSEIYILRYE